MNRLERIQSKIPYEVHAELVRRVASILYDQDFKTIEEAEDWLWENDDNFKKWWRKAGNLGSPKVEREVHEQFLKEGGEEDARRR